MAAVNCTLCNVSMASAERTTNRRGGAAALHNDCSVLEDQLYWAQRGNHDPSYVAELQDNVTRLARKKAGLATAWP